MLPMSTPQKGSRFTLRPTSESIDRRLRRPGRRQWRRHAHRHPFLLLPRQPQPPRPPLRTPLSPPWNEMNRTRRRRRATMTTICSTKRHRPKRHPCRRPAPDARQLHRPHHHTDALPQTVVWTAYHMPPPPPSRTPSTTMQAAPTMTTTSIFERRALVDATSARENKNPLLPLRPQGKLLCAVPTVPSMVTLILGSSRGCVHPGSRDVTNHHLHRKNLYTFFFPAVVCHSDRLYSILIF